LGGLCGFVDITQTSESHMTIRTYAAFFHIGLPPSRFPTFKRTPSVGSVTLMRFSSLFGGIVPALLRSDDSRLACTASSGTTPPSPQALFSPLLPPSLEIKVVITPAILLNSLEKIDTLFPFFQAFPTSLESSLGSHKKRSLRSFPSLPFPRSD